MLSVLTGTYAGQHPLPADDHDGHYADGNAIAEPDTSEDAQPDGERVTDRLAIENAGCHELCHPVQLADFVRVSFAVIVPKRQRVGDDELVAEPECVRLVDAIAGNVATTNSLGHAQPDDILDAIAQRDGHAGSDGQCDAECDAHSDAEPKPDGLSDDDPQQFALGVGNAVTVKNGDGHGERDALAKAHGLIITDAERLADDVGVDDGDAVRVALCQQKPLYDGDSVGHPDRATDRHVVSELDGDCQLVGH